MVRERARGKAVVVPAADSVRDSEAALVQEVGVLAGVLGLPYLIGALHKPKNALLVRYLLLFLVLWLLLSILVHRKLAVKVQLSFGQCFFETEL